jgi:hypothetical protein
MSQTLALCLDAVIRLWRRGGRALTGQHAGHRSQVFHAAIQCRKAYVYGLSIMRLSTPASVASQSAKRMESPYDSAQCGPALGQKLPKYLSISHSSGSPSSDSNRWSAKRSPGATSSRIITGLSLAPQGHIAAHSRPVGKGRKFHGLSADRAGQVSQDRHSCTALIAARKNAAGSFD